MISDIEMPGGDGYELMKRLRTHTDERVKRTRAIALTAFHGNSRADTFSAVEDCPFEVASHDLKNGPVRQAIYAIRRAPGFRLALRAI